MEFKIKNVSLNKNIKEKNQVLISIRNQTQRQASIEFDKYTTVIMQANSKIINHTILFPKNRIKSKLMPFTSEFGINVIVQS